MFQISEVVLLFFKVERQYNNVYINRDAGITKVQHACACTHREMKLEAPPKLTKPGLTGAKDEKFVLNPGVLIQEEFCSYPRRILH